MPPVRSGKITSFMVPMGPYAKRPEKTPAPLAPLTQSKLNTKPTQAPSSASAPQKAPHAAPVAAPRRQMVQPKHLAKGEKNASFNSSAHDWDGEYQRVIGTATRTISFGCGFVLTDDHIDDLLCLGPPVCGKLTKFLFDYGDVSYGAENDATALSDAAVVRLAKACPKLRVVQLQGTCEVGDGALLSLFEHCPDLTSLEVSGTTGGAFGGGGGLSGRALEQLKEHPEWAPKLKKLILGEREGNTKFMKAMRACGKERPNLVVTLLTRMQVKKWGDWELEISKTVFKKGRKAS